MVSEHVIDHFLWIHKCPERIKTTLTIWTIDRIQGSVPFIFQRALFELITLDLFDFIVVVKGKFSISEVNNTCVTSGREFVANPRL